MSMLTLLFGLIMCGFWVGFSDLWVLIGLAGFTMTFLIGMFIFKPTADRMAGMIARDGVTQPARPGPAHSQRQRISTIRSCL